MFVKLNKTAQSSPLKNQTAALSPEQVARTIQMASQLNGFKLPFAQGLNLADITKPNRLESPKQRKKSTMALLELAHQHTNSLHDQSSQKFERRTHMLPSLRPIKLEMADGALPSHRIRSQSYEINAHNERKKRLKALQPVPQPEEKKPVEPMPITSSKSIILNRASSLQPKPTASSNIFTKIEEIVGGGKRGLITSTKSIRINKPSNQQIKLYNNLDQATQELAASHVSRKYLFTHRCSESELKLFTRSIVDGLHWAYNFDRSKVIYPHKLKLPKREWKCSRTIFIEPMYTLLCPISFGSEEESTDHKTSHKLLLSPSRQPERPANYIVRKGAIDLLKALSKHWEIIFFTSAPKSEAEAMLKVLDPDHTKVRFNLDRDHCSIESEGKRLIKNIKLFTNLDLENTIILDSRPENVALCLDSSLLVLPFHGNAEDLELVGLQAHLYYMTCNIDHPGRYNTVRNSFSEFYQSLASKSVL